MRCTWSSRRPWRRVAPIVLLCAGLGAGAAPGLAQAGELTLSGGILTYTGGDEPNAVSAEHPGSNGEPTGPGNPADTSKLLINDNEVGNTVGFAGASGCTQQTFGVMCPTPARFVVELGVGDDSVLLGRFDEPVFVEVHANGGAGNDTLHGSVGRNVFNGGPGDDELNGLGGDDLLNGDDGVDTIIGHDGNDDLDGGTGNDRLTGGTGNDVVRGGDGNDELDYSPLYALDGTDVFEGGPGHDKVGYFGRTASVAVSLDGQANDGQSGENDNVAADIEEVDGGDAADVLSGSAGPNGLAGRGGDDTITGGGGDDVLYGDTGNDQIDGGDGNDTLDGGCHDDTIIGGAGVDSLNSDGTCADPALRGLNDVLQARDGVRDSLVLCTISGTAGDTAIVDPVDPALGPGNPGACRTIDASATGSTPGGSTPGTTTPGGGTTTIPGGTTLTGTVRATLGSTVRLLVGTGRIGQAVRQLANLKAKRPTLVLGSLVATSASRVTASATFRSRGRTVSLGSATITVQPGAPRTLSIKLSKKAKAVLRRVKKASIRVRFAVRHPTTKKLRHQSTKTFRISVQR